MSFDPLGTFASSVFDDIVQRLAPTSQRTFVNLENSLCGGRGGRYVTGPTSSRSARSHAPPGRNRRGEYRILKS